MSPFQAGRVIERREVLNGEVWLSSPVTVVHDDGDRLAVRLDPGSVFTFPSHSFGVHPWAEHPEWRGSIVLQLYRAGDPRGQAPRSAPRREGRRGLVGHEVRVHPAPTYDVTPQVRERGQS